MSEYALKFVYVLSYLNSNMPHDSVRLRLVVNIHSELNAIL